MSRRLPALFLAATLAVVGGCAVSGDGGGRLFTVATLFKRDRVVENFSSMDRLFDSVSMPVAAHRPLPRAAVPAEMPARFDKWVSERTVTSVVVLHGGELVFEDYYLGTRPGDRRISWSLAKSFLATLYGISVSNGEIGSLDDPVTKYVPALAGTAYDGATIRNLLHMASGVDFDENYGNYWSDINKMSRALVLGGTLDGLALALDDRLEPPGRTYRYSSMDTHVLAMVLRAATGQDVPALMNARIFSPLGLERDPYYLVDGEGHAFVAGGLGLTTRDYARFAQMVLDGGRAHGAQVVPRAWIDEMTTPSAPRGAGGGPGGGFGYHWWIPKDPRPGEVFSRGLYGQRIWIDRSADVVIVVTAADAREGAAGVARAERAMMRAIVEAVR